MTNFCWVVINILKLVWIFKLLSHIIYSHKECKERAKHKMSTVKFLLYILQVSITPNMHDCVSFLAVLKGGKGLLIEEKLTKNTILTYFSKLPYFTIRITIDHWWLWLNIYIYFSHVIMKVWFPEFFYPVSHDWSTSLKTVNKQGDIGAHL